MNTLKYSNSGYHFTIFIIITITTTAFMFKINCLELLEGRK